MRRSCPSGPIRESRAAAASGRSEPERVVWTRPGRDEDGLRLEVELERLDAELASETGLLVAAERDSGEGRVRHVHADGAGLDAGREPVAAGGIARPHGRVEAVLGVVREPDGVLLVLERNDRDDRAEDLLLRDRHPALDLGEHRRRVEGPVTVAELAAEHDLGALVATLLDEA